jgi:hypothetical protein
MCLDPSRSASVLPFELVEQILIRLATISLDSYDPRAAYALIFICRRVYAVLLPVVYNVFTVVLPGDTYTLETRGSSSFNLFLRLLKNPDAPHRKLIRHLVFFGDLDNGLGIPIATPPWQLESITYDSDVRQFVRPEFFRPRLVILPSPLLWQVAQSVRYAFSSDRTAEEVRLGPVDSWVFFHEAAEAVRARGGRGSRAPPPESERVLRVQTRTPQPGYVKEAIGSMIRFLEGLASLPPCHVLALELLEDHAKAFEEWKTSVVYTIADLSAALQRRVTVVSTREAFPAKPVAVARRLRQGL